MFFLVLPNLGKSRELTERLSTLAQRAQDPAQLLSARLALAVTPLSLGDPAATREQTEQGVALYDPRRPTLANRLTRKVRSSETGRSLHGINSPRPASWKETRGKSLKPLSPAHHSNPGSSAHRRSGFSASESTRYVGIPAAIARRAQSFVPLLADIARWKARHICAPAATISAFRIGLTLELMGRFRLS
jgi:hypothetical protein